MTAARGGAPLALGGAQFGLDYGITNRDGRIAPAMVERILAAASAAGVTLLDTAPAYGVSEEVIGAIIGADPGWRVVTKTVDLSDVPLGQAARRLVEGVERSLARLRRASVHALLFHRPGDLAREDADELVGAAEELRAAGVVERIGVSVYEAADVELALEVMRCQVVQAPVSLLDQRLIASGHLRRLAAAGVEVHARSVLLQGLLACPQAALPAAGSRFVPALRRVHRRADELGLTGLALALAFVRRTPGIAACVLGLSGLADLEAALAAPTPVLPDLSDLAVIDPGIVDPRRWPPG